MDSKNNIGHSADISLTAELPIPIYNGNTIMDFKNWQVCTRMSFWTTSFLSGLNIHKTMSLVVTSPVWTVKEKYSIRISLFGFKVVRYGCSPCFTIKWKIAKNGWTAPFRVANS